MVPNQQLKTLVTSLYCTYSETINTFLFRTKKKLHFSFENKFGNLGKLLEKLRYFWAKI